MKKILQNNKIRVGLLFVCCALIVVLSIVAPKYLLARTLTEQTNHVEVAPEEYYLEAGTMMSRNTSSNLSAVDRIKLISGTWDSNMTKCDITEGFLDEVEAVELAKKQLDVYYKQGVYPYSVQIQYDNLYSYSSELYCYTDTSFDTYTAYLWKITFTKYDNSVENIVYMTESGTILLAWTNNTKFAQTTTLLDFYENVQIRDVDGENKL